MNKKKLLIIIIPLLLLIIGASAYFFVFKNKMNYNDSTAVGNTAGNLNSYGFFCEYNDIIYFANPYDDNKLYSMNADCSDAKKLNDDKVASINVHGNYIYYVKNNFTPKTIGVVFPGQFSGVYRCDLDGRHAKELSSDVSGIINLCGNYIYYQHYAGKTSSLSKVKIDGKETAEVSSTECNPASIFERIIYFSNVKSNNAIGILDTSKDTVSSCLSGNTMLVDMQGPYLYYIDLDKQYSLVRINTSNKIIELLEEGRCINYNIYGDWIFYQKDGNDAGLYRMKLDGSEQELVAKGTFANVQCTSQYTFFQFYNSQGTLYRVPTSNPITAVEQITIK